MPDRRTLIASMTAVGLLPGTALAGGGDEAAHRAAKLFIYALPLYEIARARQKAIAQGQTLNAFAHVRQLADAKSRAVTTPNVDTLYSSAWLDLSADPLEIDLPEASKRYLSLALMDVYSNNFAVIHPGDSNREIQLVGPQWTGKPAHGRRLVRSPTRTVWALGRTYVGASDDLPAAHAVQDGLTVRGSVASAQPAASYAPARAADPVELFKVLVSLVLSNPVEGDASIRETISALHLDGSSPAAISPEVLALGRRLALEQMANGQGKPDQGWTYPKDDLGDFGADYLYRAQIALSGLAALPLREAVYLRPAGLLPGGLFDGARTWRMHFAPGASPPVRAFWSVTVYEPDGTGSYFLHENAQRRYALKSGDGLRPAPDGSLTLLFSAAHPAQGEDRWLQTPRGPFQLVFRAYLPELAFIDHRYRLPPLEEVA